MKLMRERDKDALILWGREFKLVPPPLENSFRKCTQKLNVNMQTNYAEDNSSRNLSNSSIDWWKQSFGCKTI
jgi:hypothetical protein